MAKRKTYRKRQATPEYRLGLRESRKTAQAWVPVLGLLAVVLGLILAFGWGVLYIFDHYFGPDVTRWFVGGLALVVVIGLVVKLLDVRDDRQRAHDREMMSLAVEDHKISVQQGRVEGRALGMIERAFRQGMQTGKQQKQQAALPEPEYETTPTEWHFIDDEIVVD